VKAPRRHDNEKVASFTEIKKMKAKIRPRNVNYHDTIKQYSSSLGAVHLAFHQTQEEAIERVRQATELYKANRPYKHLIERREIPATPRKQKTTIKIATQVEIVPEIVPQLIRDENYNADSIKILTPDQASEKFGWVNEAELAKKYSRDPAWIANGLEACRRCGVEQDYFINRYLEADKTIPQKEWVSEVFIDLLKEQKIYGSYTKC
jgi:hypothetical protein